MNSFSWVNDQLILVEVHLNPSVTGYVLYDEHREIRANLAVMTEDHTIKDLFLSDTEDKDIMDAQIANDLPTIAIWTYRNSLRSHRTKWRRSCPPPVPLSRSATFKGTWRYPS